MSATTTFTDLYIGGEWTAGVGELEVGDPTTGTTLAAAATASVEQCLAAVDAAEAALPAWRAAAPRVRSEVLRTAFNLMVVERDHIAELIQLENGKAWNDAVAEVSYAAEFFRWFAEEAVRINGQVRMAPNGDKEIVVYPEPVGVCVLITPWNFPAAMATRKVGPALAAGCTCVLKPAPETPLTALYLADLLTRAGLPAGVLNVVLPEPPAAAVSAMLAHRAVRKLSFTGSTVVGRLLLREAAGHVLRTSMELGGNAPFVMLDDADLTTALDAVMAAKMRNAGATCVAANRIYVHRSRVDEFVAGLTQRMSGLRLALQRERDAEVGALVTGGERDKVADLVDRFVSSGAQPTTGGTRLDHPGYFYPPTVLSGVALDEPLLGIEVFGPVAPVVAFDTDDDAVAAANATEAGLIAYVMSGDRKRAIGIARRIEAGMIAVNKGVISDPSAPFGGMKASGLGREGGFEGIWEFLEAKYVGLDL